MKDIREQIIDIIRMEFPFSDNASIQNIADKILALPLCPDITDADIEAWAETMYSKTFGSKYIQLLTKGAKAMRDGEIKHIE